MTTDKRIRILEIITGILLIISQLDDLKTTFKLLKYESFWPFIMLLSETMILAAAAMMIFSLYKNLILKVIFCIGIAAKALALAASMISIIKLNYLFSGLMSGSYGFILILYLLVEFGGDMIAALTMFGRIKWQSRKSLMIYTCVMFAALIIITIRSENVYLPLAVICMLPCFMQKNVEYKSVRGLAGEIAVIILGTLPLLTLLIDKINSRRYDMGDISSYYNLIYDEHSFLNISLKIIWIVGIIALAAAPLLVYDKECAIEKYAASDEEQNHDEYHFRANFDADDNN